MTTAMTPVGTRTRVRAAWDRARFYWINGRPLPSVTTVLEVIAKPALGPWYAKEERRQFETALLDVLVRPGPVDREAYKAFVLDQLAMAITGVKAADRAREQATTIGAAAHAGIEWQVRTLLGEDAGPEPVLPDGAAWAVESWKDWARDVQLEPLALERVVYCEDCGYAGTMDLYARVKGIPTILDWKTGRAIYPEAFLQNVAYRHAAARLGMPAARGLIVRLPKRLDDPAWEAMAVPVTITLADFLAALRLWRWHRRMEGKVDGRVGG